MIELVPLVSTVFLLAALVIDLRFKKDFSLIFVLTSTAYASGLLLYIKACTRLVRVQSVRRSSLILALLVSLPILSQYLFSDVTFRTLSQFIQFSAMIMLILLSSSKGRGDGPDAKTLSAMFCISAVALSVFKIVSEYAFELNFKINGANEDSFFLGLVGIISGMLRFQRCSAVSFLYFSLLLWAIYLYESRAGFLIGCFAISIFALRVLTWRQRSFAFLFAGAALYLSSGWFVGLSDLLDVERNFSNIERLAMYIYGAEFLFSEHPGYGLGNVSLAMADMHSSGITELFYPHPHSTYLRFILELKWWGAAFLALGIALLVKSLRKISSEVGEDGGIEFAFLATLILWALVESIFYSFYRGIAVLFIYLLIKRRVQQKESLSRMADDMRTF